MEAHRTRATIGEDGEVALRNIPFRPGDEVEVIVLHPSTSSETPEEASQHSEKRPKPGTARALAQSKIVGLWEDRDLPDSAEYARQLREEAWVRPHIEGKLKQLNLGDDST
jgi:hypothetical protein